MTLPASGKITMDDINVEFELGTESEISLNDCMLRAYVGILSGDISISDFYSLDVVWQYAIDSAPNDYYWIQVNDGSIGIKWTSAVTFSGSDSNCYHDISSFRYIRGPVVTGSYYKIGRIAI